MIVIAQGVRAIQPSEQQYLTERHQFIWKGFFYVPGYQSGVPSLERFLQELDTNGIVDAVRLLRGQFFMTLLQRNSGTLYAFIDHGGIFDAFHSERALSTSFLDLIDNLQCSVDALDPDKIIEFLNIGNICLEQTFFPNVRKFGPNDIATFDDIGLVRMIDKGIPELPEQLPADGFVDFFEKFAKAVYGLKVSADLTAGNDSRLVTVLLHYFGVDLETASSGFGDHIDIRIPQEVSSVIGRQFHITQHTIEGLENQLHDLFRLSDGLDNIFKHHRTLQHQQNRVNRGVDLAVSGAGGELYRDLWWLQDFPFYTRQKTNLDRLIRLRILPLKCGSDVFEQPYAKRNDLLENSIKYQLNRFILDQNTRSYDNIYFQYRMRSFAGRFISSFNSIITCYAPLLELDLVRFGFHMKRSERFFNLFHRRTITQYHPGAARVGTSEGGVSVSSEPSVVLRDLRKYAFDKTKRLAKKIGERAFGKTYFDPPPNHTGLMGKIRMLDETKDALNALKEYGVLKRNVELSVIGNRHLGNFVSLGMLIRRLQSHSLSKSEISASP